MNPEIKAEWVAALRSGNYVQTIYVLNWNNEKFCCLGVLCEIQGLEKIGEHLSGRVYYRENMSPASELLPKDFAARLGLKDSGWIEELGLSLTELNDAGFTFDQIADIVEYFL